MTDNFAVSEIDQMLAEIDDFEAEHDDLTEEEAGFLDADRSVLGALKVALLNSSVHAGEVNLTGRVTIGIERADGSVFTVDHHWRPSPRSLDKAIAEAVAMGSVEGDLIADLIREYRDEQYGENQ